MRLKIVSKCATPEELFEIERLFSGCKYRVKVQPLPGNSCYWVICYLEANVRDGKEPPQKRREGETEESSTEAAKALMAVFKIFCKVKNRDAQMISGARGQSQRPSANAATASAAWPWQVAGEMRKWMTDRKALKPVIPIAVGENSIAFPRRSVKAGVV